MTMLIPTSGPLSRNQKLALKMLPVSQVAENLLGELPEPEAPEAFPDVPKPLTANAAVRKALGTLGERFNKVVVTSRRSLTEEELEQIGLEYQDLALTQKLLAARLEQIKENIRTHQDVQAEEAGMAVPKDVRRNGNVIIHATERDSKGHYLLAAPKQANVTEIPGSDVQFSNEFCSGKTTEDLEALTRDYEAGELDRAIWMAVTKQVRVVDPERLTDYVLRTNNTSLLSRVVRKGRAHSALYLRKRKQ